MTSTTAPTKWHVSYWQCLSPVLRTHASISMLTTGSCYGWMTSVLPHLLQPNSEISITPEQEPWIVSIIEIGNIISSVPAAYLVNYIGRKPSILLSGPLYILSWLLIIHFPSVFILGLARVLQGFTMGFALAAIPAYAGEIASKSNRGTITGLSYASCYWIGYLIEYVVGPFLSFKSFTYFTLALNIPLLVIFSFQPESPYYLVMAGKEEEARKTLQYFRDLSFQELEEEMFEIKQTITVSRKTRFLDVMATQKDRKALTLLLALSAMKMLSGSAAISVYANQIFSITPIVDISTDMITIALGLAMFTGSCVGSLSSDVLGRRCLLLTTCIGCLVSQLLTATYYFLFLETSFNVYKFRWIAPVSILLYSFLCTAITVRGSYTSELFETHTRGMAASISTLGSTISSYIATLTFQPTAYWFGIYSSFYLFSFYILIAVFYFYFYAPETKGKSFVQIRREL